MPESDTTTLLASALENEAKLLLKLISELENEELFAFARRLAELKAMSGGDPAYEILSVAQNIKNIEDALDNMYVA